MISIIVYHYFVHGGFNIVNLETLTNSYMVLQSIAMFGRTACSIFAIITGYYMIESKLINHYHRLGYLAFQILFYSVLIWSIIPTFTMNVWSFSNFDFFLVMYVIGAYLRLYFVGKVKYKNIINFIGLISSMVLMILSSFVITFVAYFLKSDVILHKAMYFREMYTILSVCCAVFAFLFFLNINLYNKYINYMSKSIFAIYLIHDSNILRPIIWEKLFPNINYLSFPYMHLIIKVSVIFMLCLLVDSVRRWLLEDKMNKMVDILFDKIKNVFNVIHLKLQKYINFE